MMNYQKKHKKIWDKVSNNIKNGFDSEPVYNGNILKLKQNLMKEKLAQIFIDCSKLVSGLRWYLKYNNFRNFCFWVIIKKFSNFYFVDKIQKKN